MSVKRQIADLKQGKEPEIDPRILWQVGAPDPAEKAVLELATIYSKSRVVSWEAQVRAARFFNRYGLARTIDAILAADRTGTYE